MKHFLSWVVLIILSGIVDFFLYTVLYFWNWILSIPSTSFVLATLICAFIALLVIYCGYLATFFLSNKIYPSKRGERYWIYGSTILVINIFLVIGSIYGGDLPIQSFIFMIYLLALIVKGNKMGRNYKKAPC